MPMVLADRGTTDHELVDEFRLLASFAKYSKARMNQFFSVGLFITQLVNEAIHELAACELLEVQFQTKCF